MTQEEKQLLLRDLCARIPYAQIVNIDGKIKKLIAISNTFIHFADLTDNDLEGICDLDYCIIKPYLRPLSSMTEDEAYDIAKLLHFTDSEIIEVEITDEGIWIFIDDGVFSFEKKFIYFSEIVSSLKTFDYLNASHFDIRGLIPKDLAIEAPNNMYKIE